MRDNVDDLLQCVEELLNRLPPYPEADEGDAYAFLKHTDWTALRAAFRAAKKERQISST